MTRNELIQAVALRMDEITPEAGLQIPVDGSDNNPLYALIDGLIDGGVLELFSVAPFWRLPQTRFTYSSTPSSSDIIVDTVGDRKIIRLKVKDDQIVPAAVKKKTKKAKKEEPVPVPEGEEDPVG